MNRFVIVFAVLLLAVGCKKANTKKKQQPVKQQGEVRDWSKASQRGNPKLTKKQEKDLAGDDDGVKIIERPPTKAEEKRYKKNGWLASHSNMRMHDSLSDADAKKQCLKDCNKKGKKGSYRKFAYKGKYTEKLGGEKYAWQYRTFQKCTCQ